MSVFSAQTFFIRIKKLLFFSLHKAQFLLICALFSPLFHRNYKRFSKFNKTTQVKNRVEFCALGTKSPQAFPQLNRKGARHWASYNMLVPKMCCRVVGWVQEALVVRKFLTKTEILRHGGTGGLTLQCAEAVDSKEIHGEGSRKVEWHKIGARWW